MSFHVVVQIATWVVAVATLVAVLFTVRLVRRSQRLARERLTEAAILRDEAEGLAFIAKRSMDGPMTPELQVAVRHVEDPVLRPYKVLMVLLPDPDFEEIHELGKREFVTVAATSAEANKALAEADYAIVCKDAEARVIKWRDRSEEQIEIEFYGVPSQA